MAMIASIPHSTVKYPSYLNKLCPCCQSRVKFAYPGRKRVVGDLFGKKLRLLLEIMFFFQLFFYLIKKLLMIPTDKNRHLRVK